MVPQTDILVAPSEAGACGMDLRIGVVTPHGEEGARISGMLREAGFCVSEHPSVQSLAAAVASEPCDMVVLAAGPPSAGGVGLSDDAARGIRAITEFGVPLLVVVPVTDEAATIRALRLGADGCISPPFGQAEFLARVEALVRRHVLWGEGGRSGPPEEMVVDALACAAIIDGREVRLTPTEFRLLSRLAESEGNVVPSEELRAEVWGLDREASPGSLRLYISHLRKKLEPDPRRPRLIRTKWGVGYYLQGKTVAF